ncbi:M14 family zinc carboxypeptidase [Paucihalobacter sp.]|uniref:M14 family zinc carboxypeptidase n=1 Tax=Paucihalobacter sp. TaxID=2850405 RepID=UPI002FDFF4CB
MTTSKLDLWFKSYNEKSLSHRYITHEMIVPLIQNLGANFKVDVVGHSVKNIPIETITFGNGPTKILMWSQMHGNESTTTKALFDVLNTLIMEPSLNPFFDELTVCIVPMLNPDGAFAYTRVNANQFDLNRDAQELTQPESKILRQVYNSFKPDYCFNLHGQRTIFGAGKTGNSAVVSFLAPAQDEQLTVTNTRKTAMEIIVQLNIKLKADLPNQIGLYDDAFNINCVGDTFQSFNTPTVLVEAGHIREDYPRDITRKYIFKTLLLAFDYLKSGVVIKNETVEQYQSIPLNEKCFFDVIIRNARIEDGSKQVDIAFQFAEVLQNGKIVFKPKVEKIGDLSEFFGHKEINAKGNLVKTNTNKTIYEGYENVLVLINNEKIPVML